MTVTLPLLGFYPKKMSKLTFKFDFPTCSHVSFISTRGCVCSKPRTAAGGSAEEMVCGRVDGHHQHLSFLIGDGQRAFLW